MRTLHHALVLLVSASALPPHSPLSPSSPRELIATPRTRALLRVHKALRSWIDGSRADARLADALCAARARALASIVGLDPHDRPALETAQLDALPRPRSSDSSVSSQLRPGHF